MSKPKKTTTSFPPNGIVQILLKEYEICESTAHHYSRIVWETGAIFISASLLIVSYAVRDKFNLVKTPLLFLISVSTILAWCLIWRRHAFYSSTAFQKSHAIESYFEEEVLRKSNLKKYKLEEMIGNLIDKLDGCRVKDYKKPKFVPRVRIIMSYWFLSILIMIFIYILHELGVFHGFLN